MMRARARTDTWTRRARRCPPATTSRPRADRAPCAPRRWIAIDRDIMCSSSRAVATRLIAIDKSSRALEPALCFARVIATMHAEMARGIVIVTSSSMINVNIRHICTCTCTAARARARASGSIHLPWGARVRVPSRPVIAFARTYVSYVSALYHIYMAIICARVHRCRPGQASRSNYSRVVLASAANAC